MDAAQMREAIRILGNVPVASIHDSLGVRPCDYVNAARAVRLAFVKIDAQGITRRMFAEQGITLKVLGDYKPEECLESSYFWC
jgi:DNA-directed RNA polymerase